MRKTIVFALFLGLLLGWSARSASAQPAAAGQAQPLLTVSFAGYDALKADAELISSMVGQPDAIKGVEAMLGMVTQGKGLAGLDKSRPWGVIVQAAGPNVSGYAFIPVTDLSQLVGVVAAQLKQPPPEPVDGVYEIAQEGQAVYATQKGEWAFVSIDPGALGGVPDDPLPLLGGMEQKYLLAARAMVKNIPDQWRQMVVGQLQQGAQMGRQRMPGETAEQHALRLRMSNQAVKEVQKAIDELDTLTIGLEVNDQTNSVAYDMTVTALEGTETAQEYTALADSTSKFVGFYRDDAALAVHTTAKLSPSDVAQLKDLVATFRTDALEDIEEQNLSGEEKAVASKMINDLMDVAAATVESGQFDMGLSVLFESGALTVIAGAQVAQGDTLNGIVKQMAGMVMEEEPDAAEAVKLDADSHAGASFHTLTLPVEAMGPDAPPPEFFGGNFTVALGVAPQAVYAGLGANALSTLKAAIDASQGAAGEAVLPMRAALSASGLGAIAEAADPEGTAGPAAPVIAAMKQAGPNDHIKLTSSIVPSGMNVRLEVEEGVIRLIGTAAAAAQGGPGPGAFEELGPEQPAAAGAAPGESPF